MRSNTPPDEADRDARRDAQGGLDGRISQPGRSAGAFGGRERDGQEDEGSGDAVVEAALHVEDPAHPRRHRCVGDDRLAQGRVRRRQRGTDEQGDAHRDTREQEPRHDRAERDGQQQSNDEQTPHDGCVSTQGVEADRRRIGEQQQGEGHLGQQLDRLRLRLEGDPAEHILGQQDADGDEGERWPDRQPVETRRDERVPRDEQSYRGQLEIHCELPVWLAVAQGVPTVQAS